MYGLLLDSIQKFLCERYGEKYWEKIRRRADLKNMWFVTHEIYSDNVLLALVEAASAELGEDSGIVMRMFGEYFAQNIGHYGYARLLRVLGRDLRDFLNGLDDLHEYLRFSYPKMSPPSFFCERETEEGLLLHYTTKRSGYLQYVIGQLTTVGRIYGKDLEISVLSEESSQNSTHFTLDLKFDNSEVSHLRLSSPIDRHFSIDDSTFLGVFPFCVLLDKDLMVWKEGVRLLEVLPDLVGNHLQDCFSVRKPMLPDVVSWKNIALHANCVFELVSISPVARKATLPQASIANIPEMEYRKQSPMPKLRLKGQMLPIPKMEAIAFLCSPVMESPEELYDAGIFVNDLSMHDSSRDMILAGSQKDPELKIALSQEKIRTAQLEESIQQTDRLLFQMIPKPIADKLRQGEPPLNTCREFSSVSILFSDIVSFTPMCSRLHPMEVVAVLNAMYVAYDSLCEEHHVYKVETIGDAYMVVCGAPVYSVHHAEYITDFALAIVNATSKINDPSTGRPLRIRVGIHSGNVVAGVVGSTILRYDVFGDTVNVAARMEATGEPMRVHVSEETATMLEGTAFMLEARGSVEVKGKGHMSTFWVTGKAGVLLKPPKETHNLPLQAVPRPPKLSVSQPITPPDHEAPPISPPPSRQIARLSLSPVSNNNHLHHSHHSLSPSNNEHSRPFSPKPSEWPEASEQLQKLPYLEPIDYSVPPGSSGSRGRRNTAPVVGSTTPPKPPTPNPPAAAGEGVGVVIMPKRLHSGSCSPVPLSDVNSVLRNQRYLIQPNVPLTQQASPTPPPPPLSTQQQQQEAANHCNHQQPHLQPQVRGCPLGAELGSELNLMHIRGSIDAGSILFPIAAGAAGVARCPATVLQEMQEFASKAEQSACEARELADWAHGIVLRLQGQGQLVSERPMSGGGSSAGNGVIDEGEEGEEEEERKEGEEGGETKRERGGPAPTPHKEGVVESGSRESRGNAKCVVM